MTLIASSLVDWSALWEICLAALIGGSGVVIVFGFLLLGLKWATGAKSEAREARRLLARRDLRRVLHGGGRDRDRRNRGQALVEKTGEEVGRGPL